MHLLIKTVGALAIIAASFFATLSAMNYVWPPCPSGKTITLARPFVKNGGLSYFKDLPQLDTPGDTVEAPSRSTLMACEDNSPLGPMHVSHADIAKNGQGRYSHWGNSIVFSTSDNSDPNTNGRTYTVVQR